MPFRNRRRAPLICVICAASAFSVAPTASADPGSLDPTFGDAGFVVTDVAPDRIRKRLQDLALQANGKVVAVGWVGALAGFAIVRYKADGSLDESFAGDGIVTTFFGAGGAAAEGVAIQADGKIVVAGHAGGHSDLPRVGDPGERFALARYRRNGTLDPTFGRNGKVTTDPTRWDDYALDVVIQPNGKIIAGGRAANHGGQFAFARYRPNGNLDTTFSHDGTRLLNFSAGNDVARGLALQANGRIVAVGGELEDESSGDGRFALARLHSDGTVDLHETTDFDVPFSVQAHGVALQPDGKIVAVGDAGIGLGLVRYESDGDLDGTLDGDGMVITDGFGSLESVAIQADGRIVVAGEAGGFLVGRYGSDGTVDSTFGNAGVVVTSFGNDDARWTLAEGMALQPDGRIVAGGTQSTGHSRFIVARFLAE
jgi:uncharacterized delta-60 repeat protein